MSAELSSKRSSTAKDPSLAKASMKQTTRLAVFVSGTGRHLENLAELAKGGELDIEIALVIADRAGIAALDRAKRFDIPSHVIDPERELDMSTFSTRAFAAIDAADCDLIILAGFLRKLDIPAKWDGRALNIHPSLLPAFGGKGFWGHHVHRAVLKRGCKLSGCTVHYVDDEYDHGPILVQRAVPVEPNDDESALAARVFEAELEALPAAIRAHVAGE
ncbi:MAG: phosphoribosylglycinamide formyltransferase-1 [Planctomycetota bacterium]|jgi:phosphoribosylglycinamide formyltransferase-1